MKVNENQWTINENQWTIDETRIKINIWQFVGEAKMEAMSFINPGYAQVQVRLAALQSEYLANNEASSAGSAEPVNMQQQDWAPSEAIILESSKIWVSIGWAHCLRNIRYWLSTCLRAQKYERVQLRDTHTPHTCMYVWVCIYIYLHTYVCMYLSNEIRLNNYWTCF